KALSTLRLQFGVLDASNAVHIRHGFARAGLPTIGMWVSRTGTYSAVDVSARFHELPMALKQYHDSQRTMQALLRFGSRYTARVYPEFECIGTVSSRVIVRDPALQHIKKRYRDVLRADSGRVFVYPDYRQCEPGILANESGDLQLIDEVNR